MKLTDTLIAQSPLTPLPASFVRVEEETEISLAFNVMPDRPVRETIFIHEYRIGERYIEGDFDRRYFSSMRQSPDHLIFVTALIHQQKLLYALLCHEFGLEYDPHKPEVLKIWPTVIHIEIPKLVRQRDGLIQKLWIDPPVRLREGRYNVNYRTCVGNDMAFELSAYVKLL